MCKPGYPGMSKRVGSAALSRSGKKGSSLLGIGSVMWGHKLISCDICGILAQETIKRHRVEHIDLLSQTAFWWMMAVVIVLVTVVVIRTGWDLPSGRAPPPTQGISTRLDT